MRPRSCIGFAGLIAADHRRVEERTMSLSVSGANANNPYAALQALWQQASSANGTPGSSTSLSSLLTALDPQGGGASSTSGTSPSGTNPVLANAATPFGPQTLQALLALQANGGNQQSLAAQFENAANSSDPLSALQSGQSQGQHHHRHHHVGDGGSTSDTASSGSASSGTSGSSAGGTTGTGNNIIEQLLQMQAQLVAPAPQSVATA
jgi:hypothetical protein